MGPSAQQLPLKKTLLVIAITLAFAVLFFIYIQSTFHILKIRGESMYPGLRNGDLLLAASRRTLNRFDLIVFRDPLYPGKNIIKRLISFAGEHVQFKEGQLYINNQATPWPDSPSGRNHLQQDLSLTTPKGKCFVLGDNPYGSRDSRQFGPISEQLIWARVLLRLWPPKLIGSWK